MPAAIFALCFGAFLTGTNDNIQLLRFQYEPAQKTRYHVKEHFDFRSLAPLQSERTKDDEYDESALVVRLLPNGEVLLYNENSAGNRSKEDRKGDERTRYQIQDRRGSTLKQGISESELQPPDEDALTIPFPERPVTLNTSWHGKPRLNLGGIIDEKCTVTKMATHAGTTYVWISVVGTGSYPESTTDVKPTSIELKGERIFDATHGVFVKTYLEATVVLSGPQTLTDGRVIHDEMTCEASFAEDLEP